MRISRSIFIKLIVVIILYGILINIAVALFFKFSTEFKPRRFVHTKFDEYIIHDIGNPPDTVKARSLMEELHMNISIKSDKLDWASSDEVPKFDEISKSEDYKEMARNEESLPVHYKDKIYGVYKKPYGIFIITGIPPPQDTFNPEKAVFGLLFILSLIFLPLYFLLRWLFSPLKDLTKAVQQIGEGNYAIDLPTRRRDEFGELARSLSKMSFNIENSIKSKEQLLIDVSHELRTPLTRIKFGLELNAPKEKINEDVIEIEKMVKSILLNYRENSNYSELQITDSNLFELLESVISEYSEDKITFSHIENNKDNYNARVDNEKIKIVIRNLIDNALKYSVQNEKIFVEIKSDNKIVEILIKDNGIGISDNDLKNIFEPFYRADISRSRRTGGFGLGLAIVKKIMDSHKAIIEIESKSNEGTTVHLKFKKN